MEIALILAVIVVFGSVGFLLGGSMALRSSTKHDCARCSLLTKLQSAGKSDKVLP